jgi:hypothetical protein
MCPLLALTLPRVFLWRPLTVLTRPTRQVILAVNQSIFNVMSMVPGEATVKEEPEVKHSNEASAGKDVKPETEMKEDKPETEMKEDKPETEEKEDKTEKETFKNESLWTKLHFNRGSYKLEQGILKYHCPIDLLFDWFGLVCFANKNKNYQ